MQHPKNECVCNNETHVIVTFNGWCDSRECSKSSRTNFKSTLHAFTIICKLVPPVKSITPEQGLIRMASIKITEIYCIKEGLKDPTVLHYSNIAYPKTPVIQ